MTDALREAPVHDGPVRVEFSGGGGALGVVEYARRSDAEADIRAALASGRCVAIFPKVTTTMILFESEQELAKSGCLFRIQDNGGATYDRYTVCFCDGDALLLNASGASVWAEGVDPAIMAEDADIGRSVDLQFGDLPADVRRAVLARVNEAWADFLATVEARDPHAVAASREGGRRTKARTIAPARGSIGASTASAVMAISFAWTAIRTTTAARSPPRAKP